jgi:hypothetical protein
MTKQQLTLKQYFAGTEAESTEVSFKYLNKPLLYFIA